MKEDNNVPLSARDFESRRERAYFLWLDAGQPEGRGDEFWDRAADVLIFSYGSTMAASVMKERCPGAEYYGIELIAQSSSKRTAS